ncbi:MAG: hypothetical protein IJL67_11095, partial [Oscillospiraceae bacterium]|nr:hypothetical protein [Oscillospiraceae bacterium]
MQLCVKHSCIFFIVPKAPPFLMNAFGVLLPEKAPFGCLLSKLFFNSPLFLRGLRPLTPEFNHTLRKEIALAPDGKPGLT